MGIKQFLKQNRIDCQLVKSYPISLIGGWKNRKLFSDIQSYCMFIGCPRGRHSLIGALLDAHPNIIMAHEAGLTV